MAHCSIVYYLINIKENSAVHTGRNFSIKTSIVPIILLFFIPYIFYKPMSFKVGWVLTENGEIIKFFLRYCHFYFQSIMIICVLITF